MYVKSSGFLGFTSRVPVRRLSLAPRSMLNSSVQIDRHHAHRMQILMIIAFKRSSRLIVALLCVALTSDYPHRYRVH